MIWVIDASVAVRWFLKDEQHPHADAVLESLLDHPEHFAVPELLAFEVYAVLCRTHPRGAEVFVQGMIPLLQTGMLRHPMTERLAAGAMHFVRKGLTGYDACYAALAREIKGTWLTFDEKTHRNVAKDRISHLLTKNLPQNWGRKG